MSTISLFKLEFEKRQGIHFNNAGLSPISNRVSNRVERTLKIHQELGSLGDSELLTELREARLRIANFLGTEARFVGLTQNCAIALSQAAFGFPLQSSDSVVTLDQEYASNFYPWKLACERAGAKLIVVQSGPNREVPLDQLMSAIQPGVKLVAVSWVQFQTGAILDLETLGNHCHSVGAFLVVDGIQGLGQMPFSFSDLPVDFVVGGSHKWISSLNGQGFLASKPEFLDLLTPIQVGGGTFNRFGTFADPEARMESSARKFEPGGFGFVPLFALDSALQLIQETGVDQIQSEITRLSRILRSGIQNLGHVLVTPFNQAGGITSIRLEPKLELQFLKVCQERKIAVVKRGDFIRFSVHAFCNEIEIETVLEILKGART